jgi:GWxTD domain-containing protein
MFVATLGIKAQPTLEDRSQYYEYGTRLFAEAIVLPSTTPDSMNLYVMYRISYSIMNFSKVSGREDKFYSTPVVEFEFRDSTGIIRKRLAHSDTIVIKNYNEIKSRSDYYYGYMFTKLPNTHFEINGTFSDAQTKSSRKFKAKIIDHTEFLKKSTIGNPILTSPLREKETNYYIPFVMDGSADYSANKINILIPISIKDNYDTYKFSIANVSRKEHYLEWDSLETYYGNVVAIPNTTLNVQESGTKQLLLSLANFQKVPGTNTDSLYQGIIILDFPQNYIVPGAFLLKMEGRTPKDTFSVQFDIAWQDMPLSLQNPEYAAEVMYYMLTDEEYNVIKKGSREEVFKKILAYWKKYDPTPNTPYNEAMSEYFKRVDYAYFNFQTFAEKDGAKTDRGKIYILNGPATTIDIKLQEDKTIERWYYKRLKKEFVFESVTSGIFKLVGENEK